jgi:molybdate transport system permease protein
LAVGDPDHVPVGMYAREALEHFGWWQGLRNRLAAANSVRAALRFVETGQAVAGIVYETDAIASDKVKTVAVFPPGSHSPIRFLAATCAQGNREAETFLNFLRSPEAGSILAKYGFRPLDAGGAHQVAAHPRPSVHVDKWGPLRLSVWVAGFAVAVAAIPGLALGWLLARRSFRGKSALDGLIHAPLVMPPVTTGYLALLLLGRHGPVGTWLYETLGVSLAFSWWAAVVASAVMGFPLIVRSVRLAIESIDRRIEHASSTLGANPVRVFLTVTLPLAVPGIVAGLVLGFARSLGEFGATVTFAGNIEGQTRTLPLAVFTLTQQPGGDQAALQLVGISIALSLGAVIASELLLKRMRRHQGGTWTCSS